LGRAIARGGHETVEMRDKKDNATFDLPGFSPAVPLEPEAQRALASSPSLARLPRNRRATLKQVQLELLEPTDNSGLPVWSRDENLDLTGLPVWAPN
jgi:hypothetical protein